MGFSRQLNTTFTIQWVFSMIYMDTENNITHKNPLELAQSPGIRV